MKKLIAAGAAAALAAGVLAVPSLGAGTKTISVKDNLFSPASTSVSRGTTVKWVWKGQAPHNVTVVKGPVKFRSSTKTSGSFRKRLTKKGTYSIVCTIHSGMNLKLRVK